MPPAANPTTGTVKFMDGATLLKSVALTNTNVASFTTAALAINNSPGHAISAVFTSATTNFSGSSAALTQAVNPAATTVALASTPAVWAVGKAITFTATVAATGGGTPTGTVTFVIDGGVQSFTKTMSAGKAALSFAGFSAIGFHTVVAVYNPTANFTANSSPTLEQNVLTASTVTVASSAKSASTGQAITFTAKVAGVGGIPTGTVTFFDNGVAIPTGQSISLNAAGQATLTLTYAAAGTHDITVVYSGDSTFNPASTASALVEVIKNASGTRLV